VACFFKRNNFNNKRRGRRAGFAEDLGSLLLKAEIINKNYI